MKKRQQFKIETIEELEACFENLGPWYWGAGTEKNCFDEGDRWVVKDEDGDVMLRSKSLEDFETIENPLKKSIMMEKLYELIEKKDMERRKISIEVPNDCEARFDEENNVLIISKKKEEIYIPNSVDEIKRRTAWYIDLCGDIEKNISNNIAGLDPNELSTKERAQSFLSLMQLVEMRDAANGDWKADWRDEEQTKWCIELSVGCNGPFMIDSYEGSHDSKVLSFKSHEIAQAFLDKHIELIKKAEELL